MAKYAKFTPGNTTNRNVMNLGNKRSVHTKFYDLPFFILSINATFAFFSVFTTIQMWLN